MIGHWRPLSTILTVHLLRLQTHLLLCLGTRYSSPLHLPLSPHTPFSFSLLLSPRHVYDPSFFFALLPLVQDQSGLFAHRFMTIRMTSMMETATVKGQPLRQF